MHHPQVLHSQAQPAGDSSSTKAPPLKLRDVKDELIQLMSLPHGADVSLALLLHRLIRWLLTFTILYIS